MTHQMSLPEHMKIVQLAWPQTTNGGVTSDTVSLKNALKAWIVVEFNQAVGHATVVTLKQATDVASGTNKNGPSSRNWLNEDVAASDTLVIQTAAATVTVTNNIKKKQVVIEVDPAALDVDGGYDCVYVTISDSSQATNYCSVTAYLLQRFPQATPPAAITD